MAAKIVFLGDLTCDKPMLKAARRADGSFSFAESLSALKAALPQDGMVVANLETTFSGKEMGYNPLTLCYNSPDELLPAIRDAGVKMVTTANNHTLDGGAPGLRRTLRLLDENGILHTGAVCEDSDSLSARYLVEAIDGIRVAFVAFTDRTNLGPNELPRPKQEWQLVNQLRTYSASNGDNRIKKTIKKLLPSGALRELRMNRRRKEGVSTVTAYVDDSPLAERDLPQIRWAIELLQDARRNSDFVVACVHSGGQFNLEPGRHSVELYEHLAPYADLFVGNHPHVIQKLALVGGKPCAYSLGGVNMSPDAEYVCKDVPSEFSVMLAAELEKDSDHAARLSRLRFSLLHATEEQSYVRVHPVDEAYYAEHIKNTPAQERMARIYEVFTGEKLTDIRASYPCDLIR